VVDGYRESTQSWRELLGQLKRLGLSAAPKLAIGDGSLGFWIALQEEYGSVAQQRCWVHKTANILDKMPKSVRGKAKQLIHEMYLAPTRKAALAAYDQFISLSSACIYEPLNNSWPISLCGALQELSLVYSWPVPDIWRDISRGRLFLFRMSNQPL
jgi:transposase-like protein